MISCSSSATFNDRQASGLRCLGQGEPVDDGLAALALETIFDADGRTVVVAEAPGDELGLSVDVAVGP
jgi:hypothetical protein